MKSSLQSIVSVLASTVAMGLLNPENLQGGARGNSQLYFVHIKLQNVCYMGRIEWGKKGMDGV